MLYKCVMALPHKKRKYRVQKDSTFLQVGFSFTYALASTHADSQDVLVDRSFCDINK